MGFVFKNVNKGQYYNSYVLKSKLLQERLGFTFEGIIRQGGVATWCIH
jgi:hypothetical protein